MQSFVLAVRVYYEDTDADRVVYYPNYLKFMERARTEWLRAKGYEQDELIARHGLLFAVRSVSVEYRRPARLNDMLSVSAKIREIKSASIVVEHAITRQRGSGEEELLTTGEVKVVSLDAETFRPKSIPEQMRQDLTGAS